MHYKSSSSVLVFILMHYKEKGQCVLNLFQVIHIINVLCSSIGTLLDCKILLVLKHSIHIVWTTLKAFKHSKYIKYLHNRLNTEANFSSKYYVKRKQFFQYASEKYLKYNLIISLIFKEGFYLIEMYIIKMMSKFSPLNFYFVSFPCFCHYSTLIIKKIKIPLKT